MTLSEYLIEAVASRKTGKYGRLDIRNMTPDEIYSYLTDRREMYKMTSDEEHTIRMALIWDNNTLIFKEMKGYQGYSKAWGHHFNDTDGYDTHGYYIYLTELSGNSGKLYVIHYTERNDTKPEFVSRYEVPNGKLYSWVGSRGVKEGLAEIETVFGKIDDLQNT